MIEITTIKACVELFKDLVGLYDKTKIHKKDIFKDNFAPLMDRIEAIAKEYHAAMSDALISLNKSDDVNLQAIRDRLYERRANLAIARNGILGEAGAFMRQYKPYVKCIPILEDSREDDRWGAHENSYMRQGDNGEWKKVDNIELSDTETSNLEQRLMSKPDKIEWLSYNFARKISKYFWAARRLESYTMASGLIGEIERLIELRDRPSREYAIEGATVYLDALQIVRERAKERVNQLESRWIGVTEAFAALKLYCQS